MLTLKNRSLPWKDRLHAATDLWNSSTFLPKKEQALIDSLTYILHSNDTTLSKENVKLLWSLVAEIFTSNQVKRISQESNHIIVKSWFFEVLLANLKPNVIYITHVVDCLYSICTESCFKSFLYMSRKNLLNLLTACCDLLGSSLPEQLNSKLSTIIDKNLCCLRLFHEQQGVSPTLLVTYANKVLDPAIRGWHHLKGSVVSECVIKELLDVLLHRDALKYYERHLQDKEVNAKSFVKALFDAITTGITSDLDASGRKEMYMQFTPLFFRRYLAQCSLTTVKYSQFAMMKAILTLTSPKVSLQKQPKDILYCWSKLIKISAEYEVYNAASTDYTAQATFHQTLVKQLCSETYTNSICGDWFACLESLLQVNHVCIAKNLKLVLETAWLTANELNLDALVAQSSFLNSLLSTYNKMRQLPKLIEAILEVFSKSNQPILLPSDVLKSFGGYVTVMPPTLCVDTWLTLTKNLMECIEDTKDKEKSMRCVMTAELIHSYSKHMKVYDNSISSAVKEKVLIAISKLQVSLLEYFTNKDAKSQPAITYQQAAVLVLTEALFPMTVMANQFIANDSLSLDSLEMALVASEDHCLDSPVVLYLKVKLLVQKLTALQLLNSDIQTMSTTISTFFEAYRSDSVNSKSYHPWDGRLLSIDELNIGTAVYSVLVDSLLPVMISAVNDSKLIDQFSNEMIAPFHDELVFKQDTEDNRKLVRTLSEKFYDSWLFQDLQPLHTRILSSAVKLLSSVLPSSVSMKSKTGSVKKKRKSALQDNWGPYFVIITNILDYDENNEIETITRVADLTCSLIGKELTSLTRHQLDVVAYVMNVMQQTPLVSLDSNIIGALLSISIVLIKLTKDQPRELAGCVKFYMRTSHMSSVYTLLKKFDIHMLSQLLLDLPSNPVYDSTDLSSAVIKVSVNEERRFQELLPSLRKIYNELIASIKKSENLSSMSQMHKIRFMIGVICSCMQRETSPKPIDDWCKKAIVSICALLPNHASNIIVLPELCSLLCLAISSNKYDVNGNALLSAAVNQIDRQLECHVGSDDSLLDLISEMLTNKTITTELQSLPVGCLETLWRSFGRLNDTTSMRTAFWSLISFIQDGQLLSCLNSTLKDDSVQSEVTTFKVLTSQTSSSPEKQMLIKEACHHFVLESQIWLSDMSSQLDEQTERVVFVKLIDLLTHMIAKGKEYITTQLISSVLIGIQAVKIGGVPTTCVLEVVSSMQSLLKTIMLHHTSIIDNNRSALISAARNLLIDVMTHSDQEKLKGHKVVDLESIERCMISCCQELNKIFSVMSGHSVFVKCAGFILADMVTELLNVSLLPNVKKSLYLAVTPLLDLCDEFTIAMLKTNLAEAPREIFKAIHEHYCKYHKYGGKV